MARNNQDTMMKLVVTPQKEFLLCGDAMQDEYVLVEFFPTDQARITPSHNSQKHFILLLDVSGSMTEKLGDSETNRTKLQGLIDSSKNLVQNIGQGFWVSLLTFSSSHTELCWKVSGLDKPTLTQKIESIAQLEHGGTSLYPALQAVQKHYENQDNSACMSKIIVLTDGHIDDVNSCQGIVPFFRNNGIELQTIGIGKDFRADQMALLTSGSMEGIYNSGNYANVLGTALGDLNNAIFTHAQVEIELVGKTEVNSVAKISPDVQVIFPQAKTFQVPFANIHRHKSNKVVLHLRASSKKEGELGLLRCSLKYQVPNESSGPLKADISLQFTKDKSKSEIINPAIAPEIGHLQIAKSVEVMQREKDKKESVIRSLDTILKICSEIGDNSLYQQYEDMKKNYVSNGVFSNDDWNKLRIRSSKTSTSVSSLPPIENINGNVRRRTF